MNRITVRPLAVALACAAVFSTVPVFASAQKPDRRAAARERVGKELGLTDDQRARIDEIRTADRDAFRAARQTVAEKRKALNAAMLADPSNQTEIDERLGELNVARTEIQRLALSARQRIYQVLTPEQRERVRAMQAERRERGERGKRDRLHRLR